MLAAGLEPSSVELAAHASARQRAPGAGDLETLGSPQGCSEALLGAVHSVQVRRTCCVPMSVLFGASSAA